MKINENMATCVAEVIQGQIAARIGEGYRVEVKRVNKNGNVLHGVMMAPVDGPKPIACPVLYLEEMAGSDQFTDIVQVIQVIADELIKINIFPDEDIKKRTAAIEKLTASGIPDKEFLLDHLDVVLQNRAAVPTNAICKPFVGDISIVLKVILIVDDEVMGSATATVEMLETFGISVAEAFTKGMENMEKHHTPSFGALSSPLLPNLKFVDPSYGMPPQTSQHMFVLTRTEKGQPFGDLYGATAILHTNVMKNIVKSISLKGQGIFIIPSSRMEFIMFPDDGSITKAEVIEMQQEATSSLGDSLRSVWLSDNVFYYTEGKMEVINTK